MVISLKKFLTGFYGGKRVFVTGHTGFKGSWLALWLTHMGAKVYGYSLNPPTNPSLFDEAKVAGRLAGHTVGDIRDLGKLTAAVKEARPEVVLHLAAQPLVRLSYAQPRETYEVNVMGTVNLLEAVRACDSVRVCQIITSDKCYENREWVYPYRENDPMGGFDPYSNSKGCAELVVSAYRRSFFSPEHINKHGVSVASSRAGNVIGGGDWADDRIIPDCVRALQKGQAIPVRNPVAIRPWQHVLEPLSGYLTLAAKQGAEPAAFADAFNFGPPPASNINVGQIVQKVLKVWGSGTWDDLSQHEAAKGAVHEAKFLKLDATKAVSLLDWHPRLSVDEAIDYTIGWYRARHAGGFDAARFTLEQIENYTRKDA